MSNGKQAKVQNEANTSRRFIEESFPVKEVGVASAKEKNIRQGHISTLHIWWARRPLAASRATAYAALTPAPKDSEEWQKKRDFIIQLSQWENSNNQSLLERARREILEANGGVPPKVLDPFSGGGSYPLEALRLGCETYANDYNPVAVLVEKATLEYPQKFGRPFEGMPDWAKPPTTRMKDKGEKKKSRKNIDEQPALFEPRTGSEPRDFNPLLNAVRHWGEWVLEEARKELAVFYLSDADGNIPVGYIWARTIACQNPSCRQDIPLMRQFWLAKKNKKQVALYPKINRGKLEFSIVGDGYKKWPDGFVADNGTVIQAVATCPVCGSTVDKETTRRLFLQGQTSQRMLVVASTPSQNLDNPARKSGKYYRLATEEDLDIYNKTSFALRKKQSTLIEAWGIDPIPDEEIPTTELRRVSLPLYGMKYWRDIFNARQTLALITFADAIRRAHTEMLKLKCNEEFAKAVTVYLALNLDRMADKGATLSIWSVTDEYLAHVFGRQALPMTWDYCEFNPFSESTGDWLTAIEFIEKSIENFTGSGNIPAIVGNASAIHLPYEDNYFDCILTDPPYYDNVPYSHLSDFFYIWLKRSVGHLFSDLFITPLTPKSEEIVQDRAHSRSSSIKTKEFFETKLTSALIETRRVLKPNGIAVVVYAHKTTAGWETVINALLDSSLVITGAWPINTEMQVRLNAKENASLASSIYIVARKASRKPTGFYNDVRTELNQHLDAKLHRLWEEGIGGGDFFIAAIGSAIEVFGKYEQVMDFEGNIVRADRLLEEVRSIATNYAVKQILHNGFASEITPMTRFYVLWRWNYGEALVPFDEANKLAHSCGLDLSLQFSKNGFIKKEKEYVRMLGPQGRKLEDLDDPRDMIDVLHKTLLLWEKSQRGEMVKALADRGFGRSEAFYRVAQAISETLPNESKEKKLLDGFLAGRERVQEAVEKEAQQGRLWE